MKRLALIFVVVPLLACSPDYKSGSTKCGQDLSCPSGYVCGASGTSGAPDVCHAAAETDGCGDPGDYWCPDSQTCWSSKVACETVAYCPGEPASACDKENFVPSCSSSTEDCTPVTFYSCDSQAADDSCMTCTRQACCAELHNCMDQADCLSFDACAGGCSTGDTSCFDTCRKYYPSGASTHDVVMSCQNTQCSAKCD
jgi:hypothetical protein